uniref:Axin n=1 Tax=Terebratalia transversa TaxID=34513 RepID=A0A165USM8_TERTR|nr:axin [Terebratalia transversa]
MSIEVQTYLENSGGNKFTEHAPRPPVPGGEEVDQHSNGSSHKSKSSGRSLNSLKSNGTHSPAGTPRRSNLDKSGNNVMHPCVKTDNKMVDSVEAPLGFEPEGSVSNSPPFTETSSPPSYCKWAENFKFLIEDPDGIKLFRQFLEQEQTLPAITLDFYFACQGLKKLDDIDKIKNLAKTIYKRYIRQGKIHISLEIKKTLSEQVSAKEFDQEMFDTAQLEVEKTMRDETYPVFIKSDLFVQYIDNDSPKSSTSSSGTNSVRPISIIGPMQTINEDTELTTEHIHTNNSNNIVHLSSGTLHATRSTRSDVNNRYPELPTGCYPSSRAVNPYHVSYAPVSAQDSELQSLSSDAHTDDTMSLTDSSVDGGIPPYGFPMSRHGHRRQQRYIRRRAQDNRDTLHHHFVPRTEASRIPKDRNLAETNCEEFANLLIKKLQVIKEQKDKDSLFREKLTFISEGDDSISEDTMLPRPPPVNTTHNDTTSSSALGEILTKMSIKPDPDAQSILEEHCSRVWDSSAQDTPSRSPGKTTPPREKSPDRGSATRRTAPSGGPVTVPLLGNKNKGKSRNDKDHASLLSFDSGLSGVSGEKGSKVIHHHHHHHHVVRGEPRSKTQLERNAQEVSMQLYDGESSNSLETVRQRLPPKGRSTKKGSDTTSNIDSGISTVYEPDTSIPNPNNEKVMAWMLENEKISQGASTNTDSERSSSHKRSHKSSSLTGSPMQHRHGTSKGIAVGSSSKQPVQYNVTRSGSLERSGLSTVISSMTSAHSKGMPFQPFSQDPNMPLLEPPNPTTQLEEAKRRLEDESSKAHKNSSASGSRAFSTLPKQQARQRYPQSGHSGSTQSSHGGSTRTLPGNVPAVSDNEDTRKYLGKKSCTPAPVPSTVSSITTQEMTVVGYFFCGEPVPYRTKIQGRKITLGQFKQILTKKGNYKYFFKKTSNEFGMSGEVFEEILNENEELPLWEGKIVGKVEKCD